MNQPAEEVFDWARHWPEAQASEPVVYQPAPMPAQIPPRVRVIEGRDGIPHYAYERAAAPAYDPLPQRMYGCGVMALGVGVGGSLLEVSSWVFFKGLTMAEHAIIGVAIAVALAAVGIVALRLSSGIRISNVKIGDNSNFSIGGKR